MKLYHYVLIFAVIAFCITVLLDLQVNDFKAVLENKEQIDMRLDTAVDDGVSRLIQVDNNNNVIIDKDAAIQSFFTSLNSAFGILSDKDEMQKLNLYVPVVAVTMEDGYYICYSDYYNAVDGSKRVTKTWSEKFPYYYEDEDFVYGFTLGDVVKLYDKNHILDPTGDQTVFEVDYHDLQNAEEYASFREQRPKSILLTDDAFISTKKGVLMNCIEDSMAYYTSRHNSIASKFGITYNFSLPTINPEKWNDYLGTNGLFVVFQGYPYGEETGVTYNRVASAAAKINKKDVYYLEQIGWYLVYHRSTCPKLKDNIILYRDNPYYNIKDCAAMGAYACPICQQNGVFPPEYAP